MDSRNNREFENKGWDRMKTLLDKEMPEKKRRIIPVYWLFGAVAASLALIFMSYPWGLKSVEQHEILSAKNTDVTKRQVVLAPENSSEKKLSKIEESTKQQSEEIVDIVVIPHNNPVKATNLPDSYEFDTQKNIRTSKLKVNHVNSKLPGNPERKNIAIITTSPTKNDNQVIMNTPSVVNFVSNSNPEKIISTEEKGQNLQNEKKSDLTLEKNITTAYNPPISKDISSIDPVVGSKNQENASNTKKSDVNNSQSSDITVVNEVSKSESETIDIPADIIKNRKFSGLMVESGINAALRKGYGQQYNLGLRYEFFNKKNLVIQASATGYFVPTNVNYSVSNIRTDASNKGVSENIMFKINRSTGLNLGGFLQYRFEKRRNAYLLFDPGVSIQDYNLINSTQEMLSGPATLNKDSNFQISTSVVSQDLNFEKINMYGSLGFGYEIKNLGLELYYRLNQNGLRNSGIPDYQSKWIHQIGMNGVYRF